MIGKTTIYHRYCTSEFIQNSDVQCAKTASFYRRCIYIHMFVGYKKTQFEVVSSASGTRFIDKRINRWISDLKKSINSHSSSIYVQHYYVYSICIYLCTICLYVLYVRIGACTICMYCMLYICTVCMYVCMEEAGRWTNIPSCLSFLRYVLCKQHGPWYKLLARDLRLFPALVFTEYPLQILSAWCQSHVWTAAWRDSTHMKIQLHRNSTCIMYNDLTIFHHTASESTAVFWEINYQSK